MTANLNKSNAGGYSAALEKLAIKDGDRVIEIGFGNGREIPRVLSSAKSTSYFGVDVSDTMVIEAAEFNADLVRQKTVELVRGTSSALSAPTGSFDKALALNTIYFWANPVVDLRELRRVLRLGGRLALGALVPRSAAGRAVFQHGFRLYEEIQIRQMVTEAGFSHVEIETINETVVPPTGQPWNRDYFVISAE